MAALAITFASQANATTIFTPPINLGSVVNSSFEEGEPSISSDGLELFFHSTRPGGEGSFSIWHSTRATVNDPFGPPTNIAGTNSSASDFSPGVSADGLTLYFISTRDTGGNGNIWKTSRISKSYPFGPPTLVNNVNSSADDTGPESSDDELTLFFGSPRSGGQGDYDLWQATRASVNDDYGTPTNLGATVNSSFNDGQASITSDDLTLYFSSMRPGGFGPRSLWLTERATTADPFGTPVNLGSTVNSNAEDAMGSVSSDGNTLYFSSNRSGGEGDFDIWVTRVIPEPSTFTLTALALLAHGHRRRRA